ncbi:MAG: hypothetical protein R3B37_17720 [Nitrospira sp.]|nr:hypothetical protein [Nitrospira sp.]
MRCATAAQSRFRRLCRAWQVLVPYLLLCACGVAPNLTPIGGGPLGTVALERLASRGTTAKYGTSQTFQATHPAHLPAALVSQLLAGLAISGLDRPGSATARETYPLFSPEEIDFLAPLIANALAHAQPDQRVRFTMHDDGLQTQGTLYLHRTTLQFSLSHYRSLATDGQHKAPGFALSFNPPEAQVHTDTPQSWMIIEPDQPRVAVSVDALNQLPALFLAPADKKPVTGATPAQAAPAAEQSRLQQELQSTKDVVVKQAEELQKLKAELESVRRQLTEKESASSKARPKLTPRKPTATP